MNVAFFVCIPQTGGQKQTDTDFSADKQPPEIHFKVAAVLFSEQPSGEGEL